MHYQQLEQHLVQTLEDFRLDAQEKSELRALAGQLPIADIRYLRNKAFELVRQPVEKGGEDAAIHLRWLEQVVKTIDKAASKTEISPTVDFSPGQNCLKRLIETLSNARASLDICVFTISDDRITDAILKAHQRGVQVRVITDNDKANDRGSDVFFLKEQGVPVRLDETPWHMHHKFALVDDALLVNGSFNWTRTASEKNQENLVITGHTKLVSEFKKQFDYLWKSYK
ncbi:phospholipase D-like domain-containing protein [Pelagibaculum spongiae]|uniref:phospholipase D n=1 Tax=Pelagibaculum spongiae TaxID=2080658 RepID=A0A2V1GV59_9GAMM|nr:phospholipase D-like domain-containing protein [Pelagibaculum spongiae]PVZ63474.1 nuclease [Pelagibaculum spongiae]